MKGAASSTAISTVEAAMVAIRTANTRRDATGDDRIRSRSERA